jgi:hypothetical protein
MLRSLRNLNGFAAPKRIRRHSEEIEKLRAKGLDAEFQTMIVRENESILALHLGMHAKLLVQLSMI